MMNYIITLFCICITIGLYILSTRIHKRFPTPVTMPVFFATISIMIVLILSGISYEEYTLAKDIMTFLLGPATVALAVPLYRQRKIIFQHLLPIFIGILGGTL